MAFTTQLFLFAFFPLCFLLYYPISFLQEKGILSAFLKKIRATDLFLIAIGSLFYMWTCFDNLFVFAAYIAGVYLFGRILRRRPSRALFAVGITLLVLTLVYFKYLGMLTGLWNTLFNASITVSGIVPLLGISFITFSAVSYLADIQMGKAEAGNLLDCALYLSFFPKVVSGPIVLWRDFKGQIAARHVRFDEVTDGICRIMIGFAKKLILADTFGACIAKAGGTVDVPTAFGMALLYMLQIYYDFSGYSDIAIGLSKMLGFSVKENFNFPYLSCSITEFWRRWHISLGTWFREYIYFPLGGSRAGEWRTVLNIGVVFLLTGIWHGAGWTYMLWGIINGLCNIAEKLLKNNRLYQKTPIAIKWALTMTVTFFCWELFRFDNFTACKEWFMTMFGMNSFAHIPYSLSYFFDARMITLVVIGILGATVWGLPRVQAAYTRVTNTAWGSLVHGVLLCGLFLLSILFMVNSQYSPFIYFQY